MTYEVTLNLTDIATGNVAEAQDITNAFNAIVGALEAVGNGVAPHPENLAVNAPDADTAASVTFLREGLPRYRISLLPDPDPLPNGEFALLRISSFDDTGAVQTGNVLAMNGLGEVGIGQNPVSGFKLVVNGNVRVTTLTETSP